MRVKCTYGLWRADGRKEWWLDEERERERQGEEQSDEEQQEWRDLLLHQPVSPGEKTGPRCFLHFILHHGFHYFNVKLLVFVFWFSFSKLKSTQGLSFPTFQASTTKNSKRWIKQFNQ